MDYNSTDDKEKVRLAGLYPGQLVCYLKVEDINKGQIIYQDNLDLIGDKTLNLIGKYVVTTYIVRILLIDGNQAMVKFGPGKKDIMQVSLTDLFLIENKRCFEHNRMTGRDCKQPLVKRKQGY